MFKNRTHKPETIVKMRLARLGKKRAPFSPEWRTNLSQSLLGNSHTKGHKLTKEHREKISKAVKGEKHPLYGKHHPISGEKHYNWKGGITEKNHALRESLEYKLWRKAVFERDNYMCVVGGKSHGNKLNADHIKPFAYFPELRFAIDNGSTLCVKCHRKTDTYGWKSIKYKPSKNI